MTNASRRLAAGLGALALACAPAAMAAPSPAPKPAHSPAPNLAACPRGTSQASAERERTAPLPVPRALAGIVRARVDSLAVATLGGRTLCIDAGWWETIEGMALAPDGRFLSFGWYGNESSGFQLVDRAGKGQVVETGARPVPSPSGHLLAALEYSESGFGSLNGFAMWRIEPDSLREVARIEFPEGLTGWRFDGWQGETCVRVSAVRFESLTGDGGEPAESQRERRLIRPAGKGWRLLATGAVGCGAR